MKGRGPLPFTWLLRRHYPSERQRVRISGAATGSGPRAFGVFAVAVELAANQVRAFEVFAVADELAASDAKRSGCVR